VRIKVRGIEVLGFDLMAFVIRSRWVLSIVGGP
jgi:hypothetical protein